MQYRPEPLRERDKYRGRRRVPTPPRSRYVGVVTTALVGAGIVALGAGAAMPDQKADAGALDNTGSAALAQERNAAADQTSRNDRTGGAGLASTTVAASDAWLLPLHDYEFTSNFGMRWGRPHKGVDLAAPEGTPFTAVHDGTVVIAEWRGGYGNMVMIDHGNGLATVYGHSSQLLVKAGDHVKAGQVIALVGNTGQSTGPHLHLEIHVNGEAVEPVAWFKQHGVDLKLEMENIFS
ncbi:murein DD-endopeptidase MepM/ murein hydrolase activator NlpD [Hamadaea flava]|uniref:M23 family metallopeptidase n=2 Tax=Hamadaea flava TaxID=1742688 RepID=A0ABV8LHY0_9ACTN|nr:murein DD-endopeptidase MepM/ murein hydrolase activator NlpD [Hamadaea flava]